MSGPVADVKPKVDPKRQEALWKVVDDPEILKHASPMIAASPEQKSPMNWHVDRVSSFVGQSGKFKDACISDIKRQLENDPDSLGLKELGIKVPDRETKLLRDIKIEDIPRIKHDGGLDRLASQVFDAKNRLVSELSEKHGVKCDLQGLIGNISTKRQELLLSPEDRKDFAEQLAGAANAHERYLAGRLTQGAQGWIPPQEQRPAPSSQPATAPAEDPAPAIVPQAAATRPAAGPALPARPAASQPASTQPAK